MPNQITSVKDVEGVTGIGKATREKIAEILLTGNLQKAMITSDDVPVLLLFLGIYGVGATTAHKFYDKGYRTLEGVMSSNAQRCVEEREAFDGSTHGHQVL
jgi:DNA polymerase lambda